MTREIDNPIPGGERLFRAVNSGHVDGDTILEAAVEVPIVSTCREKYCALESPILKKRPLDTGVASITKNTLPPPQLIGDTMYKFDAEDWPEEDNEAHAHVFVSRLVDSEYTRCNRSRAAQRS